MSICLNRRQVGDPVALRASSWWWSPWQIVLYEATLSVGGLVVLFPLLLLIALLRPLMLPLVLALLLALLPLLLPLLLLLLLLLLPLSA